MTAVEEYTSWCEEKELPIFLRPWWLDAVCLPDQWVPCLAKNKDQKIIGVMPYYRFIKKNIDVVGMPFLTPYMGIYFQYPDKQKLNTRYDFEKDVVDQLITQLPSPTYFQQKFFTTFTYGLPFFWRGFRLDWRYTYYLSLQQGEAAIWEQMEGSARTQLQKTLKLVKIEATEDCRVVYELVQKTFSRQNKKMPYSLDQFNRLYRAVQEHDSGKMYIARVRETEVPVACMFMVNDHTTIYNLVLGRDPVNDPGGSIHGILWTCIQEHIGKYELFDFEGSMLEGPERMFRSFGSQRVPVLQITKYKNRVWKALFALLGY